MIVEVIGVSRFFGEVKAVDGVSLSVGREVVAIMGPNGSGKSTLLSMVAGVLRPSAGVIRVHGFNVWGSSVEMAKARSLLGYAPQKPPLRFDVSAYDNLVWHCLIRGFSLLDARRRARELLELVGLAEHSGKSVWQLSGGMVRRLVIASALVHEPDVLVMDEPSTGVDPGALDSLWAVIMRLSKGRTIIYSTHNPMEAERFSSRVAIMHRGKVVLEGEPRSLIESYAPNPMVEVTLAEGEPLEVGECVMVEKVGRTATYEAWNVTACIESVARAHKEAGFRIEKLEVRTPGLREVFRRVTGAALG
ncbi:ABC transporter ATP-binding protein [Desulfurococcus sp.]|uniref:ABC transporter ATP-binding protein n=1 Tax=Desulfurococcus sp. TaxID=51678 RepID=UPI003D0F3D76